MHLFVNRKQRFAKVEIKVRSSISELSKSFSRGVNLRLNSQITISEVYLRSEATQINLE